METALRLATDDHSALLKQIPIYVRARDAAIGREADTDELSETARVVVALRLCVSKGFKDGIGL